jgi:hypothetical protein
MRSRTQRRIGIARSVLAALLPIALSVPAFAQPVPGFPSGNPGNSYYPASPGRNAVGSAYGDSGAETPWQRRSPPYENRRGGPSYGAGPNWLPGAAGVLGVLSTMGGGTSWPSWEQVPARSEGSASTSDYQPYPGWATPPSQPNPPRSDAGPSGANWQPQPAPEPSGEAVVTPPRGSSGSSARPPSRTSHPPSARLQAAVIRLCIRPVSRQCRQHNRLPTRPVTHNQRRRLSRWLPLFQMPHPPRRRQAPLQRRRRNPRRRRILCRQIRQIRQIRQLHQIPRHQRPPKTRPRSPLQSLSSRCC